MLIYQKGNLFNHVQHGDVIAHCCNDVGAWGAGFTKALSRWSKKPENEFYAWSRGHGDEYDPVYQLGSVQFTLVSQHVCVANMVGQHGLISSKNPRPISYPALEKAMQAVAVMVDMTWRGDPPIPYRIIAPKFGAGLAGGDWNEIEKLINEVWRDFEVVIFELD
jgi:hypothetical protein